VLQTSGGKMTQLTKQLNALYVEDDETIRKNTAGTLRFFFDKVYEASNGAEAMRIFADRQIHILITDYAMPLMNGYDLALEIRKNNPKLPIIFTSSHTDKDKLLKCMTLRLIAYLEKPFSFDALSGSIELSVKELINTGAMMTNIAAGTTYDTLQKELITNNGTIALSKSEIDLIELFIKKRGQVVTKETIVSYLYGTDDIIEENAVKNAVYRLRKKLPDSTIHNIKNIGYLFR
jgi:two-component system, OmpR family, response regulator VanR